MIKASKTPSKPGATTRALAPAVPLAVALFAGHILAPPTPSTPTAPIPPAITSSAASRATKPGSLAPLLSAGEPVDWWFVFKLNAAVFPGCGGSAVRSCPFGGTVQSYTEPFSQQFTYASSQNHALQQGGGCVGDTTTDPVGATFDQIYHGNFFYVVWNDQFKGDPMADEDGPAGHSKGVLAWDSDGNGLVMQVSTPSWPGSGNSHNPRTDGNSLGCVTDNDVLVSQHFFSLKLNKDDVVDVIEALENASVVTDPSKLQIVSNGGPQEISTLVGNLGKDSSSKNVAEFTLSSGVVLISKASGLHVPPWQMVSAQLGGEPLRVASWWAAPEMASTTASSTVACWDASLAKPGAVEIATTGTWDNKAIGLKGGPHADANHAKVGVSTGTHPYVIFGDMNQQGSLSGPNCASSQNGRGGLFFVLNDGALRDSVSGLIKGDSAPAK